MSPAPRPRWWLERLLLLLGVTAWHWNAASFVRREHPRTRTPSGTLRLARAPRTGVRLVSTAIRRRFAVASQRRNSEVTLPSSQSQRNSARVVAAALVACALFASLGHGVAGGRRSRVRRLRGAPACSPERANQSRSVIRVILQFCRENNLSQSFAALSAECQVRLALPVCFTLLSQPLPRFR